MDRKTIYAYTLGLISLVLVTAFCGCTSENRFADSGATLLLSVSARQLESRELVEDSYLPDESSIGVFLTDGTADGYCGHDYDNIMVTASSGLSPQVWTPARDISLFADLGTVHAYFPYSGAVADPHRVPVAAGVTDYMWATPVPGVCDTNADIALVMHHAMTAIRLDIVRGTYSGTGQITSVGVRADNLAASAVMDAADGTLTDLAGAGTDISRSLSVTLGNAALQADIVAVPVGGAGAAPTFTLVIDGREYTATGSAATFAQGCINSYTLTVNDGSLGVTGVSVDGWDTDGHGGLVVQAGHQVTIGGDIDDILLSYDVADDGSVTVKAFPGTSGARLADAVCSSGATCTMTVGADGVVTYRLTDITSDVELTFNGFIDNVILLDIQSNQGDSDTSLSAVTASVSVDGVVHNLVHGQELSVPIGSAITVTYPDVTGYATPAAETFTHPGGVVELTGLYQTELLTVNVGADSGTLGDYSISVLLADGQGEYTHLDYIQSTGSQYIDTGFKPNSDTRVIMDAECPLDGGKYYLFGARTNSNSNVNALTYGFNAYQTYFRTHYYDGWLNFDTSVNFNGKFTIDKNKNVTTLGTETLTDTYTSFQCAYNMYLFAVNTAGTAGTYGKANIYTCQVYDNGTLIRDYIPSLRSDGAVGLYDRVGGTFSTSAGSSAFVAGPILGTEMAVQTTSSVTYKVPFGQKYALLAGSVDGYTPPETVIATADAVSATVDLLYKQIKDEQVTVNVRGLSSGFTVYVWDNRGTLLGSQTTKSMTYSIPVGTQYYVTASTVNEYITPSQTATFTAVGNGVRTIYMDYESAWVYYDSSTATVESVGAGHWLYDNYELSFDRAGIGYIMIDEPGTYRFYQSDGEYLFYINPYGEGEVVYSNRITIPSGSGYSSFPVIVYGFSQWSGPSIGDEINISIEKLTEQ